MRIFAYCRVSTTEQSTENQIIAIHQKGYEITDSRVVSETVSGSVEAMKREKFKLLINRVFVICQLKSEKNLNFRVTLFPFNLS